MVGVGLSRTIMYYKSLITIISSSLIQLFVMILLEEFQNLMTKRSIQAMSASKEPRIKLPTTASLKFRRFFDPNPSENSDYSTFSPRKTTITTNEDTKPKLRFNKPNLKTRNTVVKLSEAVPSSLSCAKAILHLDEDLEFAIRKKAISFKKFEEQMSKELRPAQGTRKTSLSQITRQSSCQWYCCESPELKREIGASKNLRMKSLRKYSDTKETAGNGWKKTGDGGRKWSDKFSIDNLAPWATENFCEGMEN